MVKRKRLRIEKVVLRNVWRRYGPVRQWTENPFSSVVAYMNTEVDDWEIFNNRYDIEFHFEDGTQWTCASPADFAVASYWTLVDWHDGRELYGLLSHHPYRPSSYGGHPVRDRKEREVITLMRFMRDHIMATPKGVEP
jgi:hypothetical protein